MPKRTHSRFNIELRVLRQLWGKPSNIQMQTLKQLIERFRFSIISGDLLLLDGRWYVTHSGLVGLAERRRCSGIVVSPVKEFCNPESCHWAFRAAVYPRRNTKGFVGYGDADPSNVSAVVRGAEMRIAETRAVNRALRKAYGIGICSVEELGALRGPAELGARSTKLSPQSAGANGKGNGQPKLRDRLCLLIRQHRLDGSLVKSFATDFCGISDLRQASREQIEAFITHISRMATVNPNGLASKLNSYAAKQEGAGAA